MTLLGVAPALPLHAAGKYVAGAYVVFVLLILIYVAIMAVRLVRMQRQLVELSDDLDRRDRGEDVDRDGGDREVLGDPNPATVGAGRPAGDSSL